MSVSPAIWQTFINIVLDGLPPKSRKHHLAIMDDILTHSKQKDHTRELVNLFKALIKAGLKISPKKCQFFRLKLTYMGHTMIIRNRRPCITPLKKHVDSVLKFNTPCTFKDCKSFMGLVNFLSFYQKNLQTILIPIYKSSSKKKGPFFWGEKQQQAFEKIKKLITSPPVLVMPNNKDLFQLHTDTSKIGTGAALYQRQEGVP